MILFEASTKYMPALSLAGEVYIPGPNEHFARTPREYILYYVRGGEMLLTDGNREYALKAGDVILLDPSRRHFGRRTESPVEYYYVHFVWEGLREYPPRETDETSGATLLRKLRMESRMKEEDYDCLYIPQYLSVPQKNRQEVEQELVKLIGLVSNGTEYHRMLSACEFLFLLGILLRTEEKTGVAETETAETGTAEEGSGETGTAGKSFRNKASQCSVSNLLTYLQCNYRHNLSSEDIEKDFHMNFDYLNRIFKKATGTTLIAYHNRYRIREARKLLESGAYSVKQVASLLGFSNEFYFSRVYKAREGISPAKCNRGEQ